MNSKQLRTSGLLVLLISIVWFMSSCKKDNDVQNENSPTAQIEKSIPLSPDNPDYFTGEIPEATIPVERPVKRVDRRSNGGSSLTPEELNITTRAGVPFSEDKIATLSLPAVGDVMFHFDISLSMSQEINNVKNNAQNIFNDIDAAIDDFQAGVSSGLEGYSLNEDLTSSFTDFSNGLSTVSLVGGTDEDYAEHFLRTANDPSWRTNAARVAIVFLDETPQEYSNTMAAGLAALASAGVKLIVVYSGSSASELSSWQTLATNNDFDVVKINGDGTIPNGVNISDFIIAAIEDAFCDVGTVELKAIDANYQSWISSVSPSSYTNVNVCPPTGLDFTITFEVPDCTTPGDYSFDVGLYGDGILYATQKVNISVEAFAVGLDVHPGSCPNPLNTKSKGMVPVAILGSAELDVRNIDLSQITLNGVAPVWNNYGDVATPEMPLLGKDPANANACNTAGPDGYEDLKLRFPTTELVATLGNPEKGDVFILDLDAKLNDGTCIDGEDVIIIAK